MTRLAMSALFGHLGHVALAAQSQIPLRTGDCVQATQALDFFYKDEGEYERTHRVEADQPGTLLHLGNGADDPSTVEFIKLNSKSHTREPEVEGAVFMHQFARVPWEQGVVASGTPPPDRPDPAVTDPLAGSKCMTADVGKDGLGYQPVVRMTDCAAYKADKKDKERWAQQLSFSPDQCGARPIRSTADPSKCVDAVHPNKVLLTDCSGVDSQKFQFRCEREDGKVKSCFILAMGGRKDMCLWFDENEAKADLQVRSCNFEAKSSTGITNPGPPVQYDVKKIDGATFKFFQHKVDLFKQETRPNTAPATP